MVSPVHSSPAAAVNESSTASRKRTSTQASFEDRYELQEEIGEGASARVYEAYDHVNGRQVAVKKSKNPQAMASMIRERGFLQKLTGDPHFVQILGFDSSEHEEAIVEELLPPDVCTAFATKKISWPHLQRVYYDGFGALASLKRQKIVHRDIKTDNFALCEDGQLRLFDFGLAKKVSEISEFEFMQHRSLRPPEVVYQRPKINCSADIWSLGCMMFELASGGKDLFEPKKMDCDSDADIDLMTAYAVRRGRPPGVWTLQNEKAQKCFADKGELPAEPFKEWVCKEVQAQRPEVPKKQICEFAEALNHTVDYERIDAEDGQKLPFFIHHDIFYDCTFEEGDECLLHLWPAKEFLDEDNEIPILQVDLAKCKPRSRHMIPQVKNNLFLVRIYFNAENTMDEIIEIPPRKALSFDGKVLKII